MKTSNVSKIIVAAITLASAQYGNAGTLSESEIKSVRQVLRALNFDEAQVSNEMIEELRNRGQHLRFYDGVKSEYLKKSMEGEIYMTCGAGTHGGGKDPV